MSEPQVPIVCTLNSDEFRERESVVLNRLKDAIRDANETVDGYIFSFDPDEGVLPGLGEFINLERQCCPFIDFTLKVERGDGNITLELSGPEGAKEFIAATFLP